MILGTKRTGESEMSMLDGEGRKEAKVHFLFKADAGAPDVEAPNQEVPRIVGRGTASELPAMAIFIHSAS